MRPKPHVDAKLFSPPPPLLYQEEFYSRLSCFSHSMKDSAAVALGTGPLGGDFLGWFTVLERCSGCLSPQALPTMWSVSVFGRRGNAEIRILAPPSGALYLMTWSILYTETHTHNKHTHIHQHLLTLDPLKENVVTWKEGLIWVFQSNNIVCGFLMAFMELIVGIIICYTRNQLLLSLQK